MLIDKLVYYLVIIPCNSGSYYSVPQGSYIFYQSTFDMSEKVVVQDCKSRPKDRPDCKG